MSDSEDKIDAMPQDRGDAEASREVVPEAIPAPAVDAEPEPDSQLERPLEAAPSPEPEAEPAPVPASSPEPAPAPAPAPAPGHALADRIPFWVLGGIWAVFVALVTYLLWPAASSGGAFVTAALYPVFVFGGAALVLLGFVTGLTVWLLARGRARDDGRAGIGRAVWLRALGWTAGGVALWWVGMLLLDAHRSGLIR